MTDFKQLLTAFERFAYGQSLHTAFTELLDWTLLPFKQHTTAEKQSIALETYRKHSKVNQLVPLITLIGELSEGFADPLGELFMQAISSGHNGQFFTPTPICEMISAMSVGETLDDNKTVCDPACGSGRMLLAAAKLNRHALLYGADLDITCCKMALLNMLLNSLQGEIAHMNTLSNKFYVGYKLNIALVNDYHSPYYIEFTEPELSYIWLRPIKQNSNPAFSTPFEPVSASHPINGIQGSLF
ncbi:N-6 DNA methylase [Mucilaginibacter mallensis]|nr:N-6 DNA methylase [Mucilaginibacter mallensis]